MHLHGLQARLGELRADRQLHRLQTRLGNATETDLLHGLQAGLGTRTKNICYTVCKPVCETRTKDICYTVCKPVYETRTKNICYTVCKPVWETKHQATSATRSASRFTKPVPGTDLLHRVQAGLRAPGRKTCARYTVCKPVWETKHQADLLHRVQAGLRDPRAGVPLHGLQAGLRRPAPRTCATPSASRCASTRYRDLHLHGLQAGSLHGDGEAFARATGRPGATRSPVQVSTKCCQEPGGWTCDPCRCRCVYCPGLLRRVQCQCPPVKCYRKCWVPEDLREVRSSASSTCVRRCVQEGSVHRPQDGA